MYTMKGLMAIGLILVLVGITGVVVLASYPSTFFDYAPNANLSPGYDLRGLMGGGMMGGGFRGGGMMGGGMMGGWNRPQAAQAYSIDGAIDIAKRYLRSINNPDLDIDEIMEFDRNFYVIYYEKSTGKGAFEMIIDKYTGQIFPEYGPNMMWNTKYGMRARMMGPWTTPSAEMPIGPQQAAERALVFLQQRFQGDIEVEEPTSFYGYYTLDFKLDGETYGMLSVNGYNSSVWYHSWHGTYFQSRELN